MRGNAFEDIFAELGVADQYAPSIEPDDPRDMITIAYKRKDWDEYNYVSQGQAMADPEPFFKLFKLDEAGQAKMTEIMTEMITMEDEQLSALDDVPLKDWLLARDCPPELYSYMGYHANASLAEPIELVSTSETIVIMKQLFLQGGGGQYKGGFGHLTDLMITAFEKNGGTLIKNCKVEKIIIENGAAKGVVTSEGTFNAPVVISNAGIQPTILKLAGEEHFDKAYTNYIRDLTPGWAYTSIRYFLDKEVMETGLYVTFSDESYMNLERYNKMKQGELPEEVALFMCNHNFYDPNAAPPGKQVLVAGTICSADPNSTEIEALHEKVDAHLKDFFPEIWAAVERKEYTGPKDVRDLTRDSALPHVGGECVGVGQIVGQCGKNKPKSKTPVNGLYITGADAGAPGMGTHQSALSGSRVTDMVQTYLQRQSKL
jgi:prolycopene isomerase